MYCYNMIKEMYTIVTDLVSHEVSKVTRKI